MGQLETVGKDIQFTIMTLHTVYLRKHKHFPRHCFQYSVHVRLPKPLQYRHWQLK